MDEDNHFYFSLMRMVSREFQPVKLYRVRAGSTEPELVPEIPTGASPTNGFGYIVGPDGTLWTIFSSLGGDSLSSLEPGEEWKELVELPRHTMHAYVSPQGRVFVVEAGYRSGEAIFELVN